MVGAPVSRLGARYEAAPQQIDVERALAYARATNDVNPLYDGGLAIPPVFGVVPVWPVFAAAVADLVPVAVRAGLLHASHDMHFHRPLAPGDVLASAAELVAIRAARAGSWLTLRITSNDQQGALVLEQFTTVFVRGFDAGASGGVPGPPHAFGAAGRTDLLAEVPANIDLDQTVRYRDASGDTNPIHVDLQAARQAGLDGIVIHGLCTMAMCGRSAIEAKAHGDPRRLVRLAVRFSAPVFPGNSLTTSLYAAVSVESVSDYKLHSVAFEAHSGGQRVIRDGLAAFTEPAW